MDKKRERSANFNVSEIDILISLIQKHKNIIENKQSDSATWKMKEAAWSSVEKEFNACSGGVFRNAKTLRIKYEGLKRLVRKKSALLRSELYRTGGGVSTAVPLDGVEEQIKDLIKLSTDGMESIYDSDILPQNQDGFNAQPHKNEILPSSTAHTESEKTEINDLPPVVQNVYIVDTFPPAAAGELKIENNKLDVSLDTPTSKYVPTTIADVTLDTPTLKYVPTTITGVTLDTPTLKYVPTTITDVTLDTPTLKYVPTTITDVTLDTPTLKYPKQDFTFTRKNLKSRRHAALTVNKKSRLDELTQAKLELVELQKKLLEAEIIEKRKEWEFKDMQRKWLEEEHKLKLEKLRRELND